MAMMRTMIAIVVAWLALASTTGAHMEMSYPPPFRSKYNSFAGQNIDYSMTSPITPAQFPCKGYQSDLGTAAGASVATFNAGETHNFTIVGGATHGGGSCQASLSYDKGATFKVITSFIGSCPLTSGQSFDFTVPSDAPAGDALFAWTWYNKIGNREIYMNCASITVAAGSKTQDAPSVAFSSRPDIFKANLDNGCTTVENTEVVFPDPGPDVVNKQTGNNAGSLTGNCGAASGGNSSSGAAPASSGGSGSSGGSATSAEAASSQPTQSLVPVTSSTEQASAVPTIANSVTIPSTSPGVVLPSSTTTNGIGATPSVGGIFVTTSAVASTTAPFTNSSTASAIPIIPTTLTTVGSTPSNATAVPSASSAAASSPVESSPVASTPVATSPVASAAPSTPATSGTPSAGALSGACTQEGLWNCIGGTSFQRCASGEWSAVLPVAAGTQCTPGQSTNFNMTTGRRRRRRYG